MIGPTWLRGLALHRPARLLGTALGVAVARALAGRPRIILADEPTGQLDRAHAAAVVELLLDVASHAGAALVVSTHDPLIADRLPAVWELHSGRLTRQANGAVAA